MCFYLVGDGQVKRSKNEQKGVKGRKIGQVTRACRGMVLPCRSMRPSSQKLEAVMPQHAPFMPQHAMAVQKSDFPIHVVACQIMLRHDDTDKTMLFLASRALGLLCNTTFFVSIKRK